MVTDELPAFNQNTPKRVDGNADTGRDERREDGRDRSYL